MHFNSLLSLALASAVASSGSPGCNKTAPAHFPTPGSSKNLQLPGSDREYRLFIPANYSSATPAPVYFSFHGASKNMTQQEDLSQFSNPEFNKDGIAIYPNSQNGYWLSHPKANTSRPNDLDFTNDLLNHVEEELCVDRNRVFSAGKSNGGGFTTVIACNATVGSRFTAFSSVSGAYYDTDDIPGVGPCKPAPRHEGYPFLEFHGTTDTTAPIDGNTKSNPKQPVIDVLDTFAKYNGCGSKDQYATVTNETVFEDPLVKHVSWDCEGRKGIVQHYREGDNGHCWPSTVPNNDFEKLASQCKLGKYVFNATEYIFDFFGGYRLNQLHY